MPRLFVLTNVIVAMTMGVVFLKDASSYNQIERPIRMGKNVFSRYQNAMLFTKSPSLLFLHLLKYKPQYQKLDKISTTTPLTRDCICVPFYLCDNNQTIIIDGIGLIDVRIRRCTGDLEVCCYLPNVITIPPTPSTVPPTRPSTMPSITFPTIPPTTPSTAPPMTPPTAPPMTPPTAPPMTPPTVPPVIFPTGSPSPPTTGPPSLICICVAISQCDPNGIVTISGEGIINPRGQSGFLCPGVNQVCCRISATITPSTMRPTTMTTMTVPPTLPPGHPQICFVCGNIVQCITCGGIIITPGNPVTPPGNPPGIPGVIDPRLPMARQSACSAMNQLPCQATTILSSLPSTELGLLKNPGTPQACYCVKTWLCSQGNVISPDGLGVIDPRFTTCASADQVCCRPTGVNLQIFRSDDLDVSASSSEDFVVYGPSSSPQAICGIQDNNYAPSQPFPVDSEKTYFAEFPWMVALLIKSASGPYVFQCGASMINNRAVLTAAHCVTNQKLENLIARFGQWDIRNNTQPLPVQETNILAKVTHPSYYSGGLFHDIAVLILDKPVAYSANVLPICLPEQGMIFPGGTRCYGTGWGRTSFGPEGKYQAELRKVELPIVERADCQTRLRSTKLGQYFQLHGSFICAGGEVDRDTCRGDGGGPLTCRAATGQFFQAGIVSWGIGCGASNVPAVYASVSQHRQWIDQQLATYGVQ